MNLDRQFNETECIKILCDSLNNVVNHYLNGFPLNVYISFNKVMNLLMGKPLKIYRKSSTELFEVSKGGLKEEEEPRLFRVVSVDNNKPYQRTRLFHTPFNLRSKVSTSRYSIASYPSLYSGTSLALCCEEIHSNPYQSFTLASMFKLERTIEYTSTNIRVIELGVEPQDFINIEYDNEIRERCIPRRLLEDENIKSSYLIWYPLIASCSYIRTNKKDPFAQYIIPRLLMQWVCNEIRTDNEYDRLVGIRYFSFASVKSSDMGFNYVFLMSGQPKFAELPYCSVLSKAFRLTNPVYIHVYDDIRS